MDIPLQSTSPSSRRNKGKLAEAIQSMASLNNGMDIDLPTDPDAQATVTDFLDFTEYLPSDMIRSLTLIGNLDQTYTKASAEVHDLTTTYGQLPSLPADAKPNATKLRSEISMNLAEAVGARTASYAEACRMVENAERHYNRIKTIHAKLVSMAETYPASREPSPLPSKSPTIARAPKITLRVAPDIPTLKVRKARRGPRITVPGEVLAPYELDYESYDSEEESEEEYETTRETPARNIAANSGKIRLKVNRDRIKKEKIPKLPRDRENRPPGFGTNVHSQVAGISTSNALRLLDPPPEDARPGSKDLPWLALSDYELGVLRKKMKKNAVWVPSDTMIKRELKERGRGMEAYLRAKRSAEERGETIDTPEQLMEGAMDNKDAPAAPGTLSVEAANKDLGAEENLVNRGMKLNEAKKLKKLQLEKEREKEMVEGEAAVVEATRRVNASLSKANLENLFTPNSKSNVKEPKTTAKTPSRKPAARKRKRDSEAQDTEQTDSTAKPRPVLKRSKTETPVPAPLSIAAKQATPASEVAPSTAGESAPVPASSTAETTTESLTVPSAVLISPKKSSTPILPPQTKRGAKNTNNNNIKPQTPTLTDRPRRGSKAATPAPDPKRPTSSRSIDRDATATATIDRPRRASTARNTPAPAPAEPRGPSKRAKRPAPGVVTKGSEDSTAVSVGKRSAATRKKKEKGVAAVAGVVEEVVFDEIDDEGNVIDPNEPRYCLCNRVSFGTMIGCENVDVSLSLFWIVWRGVLTIAVRERMVPSRVRGLERYPA